MKIHHDKMNNFSDVINLTLKKVLNLVPTEKLQDSGRRTSGRFQKTSQTEAIVIVANEKDNYDASKEVYLNPCYLNSEVEPFDGFKFQGFKSLNDEDNQEKLMKNGSFQSIKQE